MSNLDIFVNYGSQMVAAATNVAVVGLIGSGLSRKEVKLGVVRILNRNNLKAENVKIDIEPNYVIFTMKR